MLDRRLDRFLPEQILRLRRINPVTELSCTARLFRFDATTFAFGDYLAHDARDRVRTELFSQVDVLEHPFQKHKWQ